MIFRIGGDLLSVRKVYQVLVDGKEVFSGSYAMALAVYESYERWREFSPVSVPTVVIAFKPV